MYQESRIYFYMYVIMAAFSFFYDRILNPIQPSVKLKLLLQLFPQ